MRDRRNEEIPDSAEDTIRDFDAPTQLWSGRLSLSSLTPRSRAARRRARLEALLNTQTGITFEAHKTPDVRSERAYNAGRPARNRQPSAKTEVTKSKALSGPQLALFIALGVAVGGIAALQVDRALQPLGGLSREPASDPVAEPLAAQLTAAQPAALQPPAARAATAQPPGFAVAIRELPVNEPTLDDPALLEVAVPPARPMRSLAPKARAAATDAAPVSAPTYRAGVPATTEPKAPKGGDEPRIPTQLHPRINPLMTSNQVFYEK